MKIEELISYCVENKKTVCLTGGGGKTTLMYKIADMAAKGSKKTVVSTTTHIMKPDKYFVSDMDGIRRQWKQGNYAVTGAVDSDNREKLIFPADDMYEEMKKEADLILLEADGAKRFPCKVPADYEPVIRTECDLVIGVLGMTALGKTFTEGCFRFDTDGRWLSVSGNDLIDEKKAAEILASDKGTRKGVENREYIAVLNQCDDDALLKRANRISEILWQNYGIRSVCCSLKGNL